MRPPASFLNQPVRSLQTMLQVLAAQDPAIPRVIPDGIYGSGTMHAVSAFQRREGLPVTGMTNQKTWEALAACYRTARIGQERAEPVRIAFNAGQVIRAGESHRNLYLVQAMLTVLSLDCGCIPAPHVTGILDEETQASLRAFQQLSGLPATGTLDRCTWKHLALQYPLAVCRG